MSSKPDLRLAWCSADAATYAVKHWHYSRTMPKSKRSYIGVWEGGAFIGAIIFGCGSGHATDGRRFGLARQFEIAELLRVALRKHRAPVTRIVAVAVRMLYAQSPGLRILISYADPRQEHLGVIYQAGNWIYTGETGSSKAFVDRVGQEHHERVTSVTGWKKQFGKYIRCLKQSDAVRVIVLPGKHRYLYPLDAEMRERLAPLAKPYPKSAGSIDVDAPAIHAGEGGSTPTSALQTP